MQEEIGPRWAERNQSTLAIANLIGQFNFLHENAVQIFEQISANFFTEGSKFFKIFTGIRTNVLLYKIQLPR